MRMTSEKKNKSRNKKLKKKRTKVADQKTSREALRPNLLAKNSWPKKTDILFRPERYDYVKKQTPHDSQKCVFCVSAQEPASFETLCLFKNELVQVVMNKYPYNAGHLLVLPIRHEGDFLKLTEAEGAEIYRLKRQSMAALSTEYSPQAFNLGGNMGAAAGAGIPEHLHFHIIPRWNGDTNFFPLIAETKVIIEDLARTYERLQKYFL